MSLLKVSNLCFSYGTKKILNNISLELSSGELVALVGPNGSGKSTLLQCIAGLLPSSSSVAKIIYNGMSLKHISIRERAALFAYLAQNEVNQFPYTVFDIVGMGLSHKKRFYSNHFGEEESRFICQLLGELGLAGMGNRLVQSLSGGEWQRVMICRALAQQSPLLFLDEPTSALDLKHQKQLYVALRNRINCGDAGIIVLHDLNFAAMVSDRILLMNHGELVAQGSPRQVFRANQLEGVYGTSVSVNRDDYPSVRVFLDPVT